MPVYEFACKGCELNLDFVLSMAQSGSTMSCPKCQRPMQRVYYAPQLLNREKPGTFGHKPKAHWNANDQKLAALRLAESKGPRHLREAYKNFGKTAKMVQNYRKKEYGS